MKPIYTVKRMTELDWDAVPVVELAHAPWLEPCAVTARARLCRDDEALWVRMEAKESPVRAELTGKLDPVCTDSCLEFFFAPLAEDHRYFNFEWNLLGTLCLGFGAERPTRVRQVVKDAEALFHPRPFRTEGGWGITFRIPLTFLRMYFPDCDFRGEAACNFYKCGDATPVPHYLAWSPLTSDSPDFHRRQDFGRVLFE